MSSGRRWAKLLLCALVAVGAGSTGPSRAEDPLKKTTTAGDAGGAAKTSKLQRRFVSGRVVWLADALRRRHGLEVVPEARQRILAIETAEGRLLPIAEDTRGKSLRVDQRLRQRAGHFLIGQYPGSPVVQLIRIFEVDRQGHTHELDYWCDICAIVMFELKACDCCQGPIELRSRRIPKHELVTPDKR